MSKLVSSSLSLLITVGISSAVAQSAPLGAPTWLEAEITAVGGIAYFRYSAQADWCQNVVSYPVQVAGTNVSQAIQKEELDPFTICICNTFDCGGLPPPPPHKGVSILGALAPGNYMLMVLSTNGMFSFPPFMVRHSLLPFSVAGDSEPTLQLSVNSASRVATIAVAGVSNVNYVVEASSDLANWTPIHTNRNAPFSLLTPANQDGQFFRTAITETPRQ
jgi:hypothetical protein